jgi:hypothetical protein
MLGLASSSGSGTGILGLVLAFVDAVLLVCVPQMEREHHITRRNLERQDRQDFGTSWGGALSSVPGWN